MKQLFSLLLAVILASCTSNSSSKNSPQSLPTVAPPTQNASAVEESNLYKYLIKQPTVKNPPVLFLLHGYGSNEKDLFSFAEILDDRLMVICPQAPKSMGATRFSWFDLQRTAKGMLHNEAEVIATSDQLIQFIDHMQRKYQFNSEKVFIGGFSQGAILSLGTGLLRPDKIKGVVCLSGQLYPEFVSAIGDKSKASQLKVFLSHGREDTVLPFARIEKDVETLKKIGVEVDKHYYNARHTITQQNIRDLQKWLSTNLN